LEAGIYIIYAKLEYIHTKNHFFVISSYGPNYVEFEKIDKAATGGNIIEEVLKEKG
jgi:hypothetical protein